MIANDVLKTLAGEIEKKMPEILTVAGIGTGLCTIGGSIFAGWKIHEVVIDEENHDKKEKAIKIAKYVIPVIGGTTLMVVCHVSASKEYMRRIAELGTLYAASQIDIKEFKKEIGKVVGDDKVEVVEKKMKSEKMVHPNAPTNEKIRIIDTITGYQFECTMLEFWNAVNKVNDLAQYETVSMETFYEELLGYDYENAETHHDVCFGGDIRDIDQVMSFRPLFGSRLDDGMKLMYTIEYPYNKR